MFEAHRASRASEPVNAPDANERVRVRRGPSKLMALFAKPEVNVLVALIGLCIVMTFTSPYFLTFKNELNILRQFSLIAILAVGEGLIIITAGIDLSVGALVGMTACAGAWAAAEGAPPSLTLLVILGSGALAGLINGLLVRACPVILARFRLICGGMTPSG